jgi:hypothetical protein
MQEKHATEIQLREQELQLRKEELALEKRRLEMNEQKEMDMAKERQALLQLLFNMNSKN